MSTTPSVCQHEPQDLGVPSSTLWKLSHPQTNALLGEIFLCKHCKLVYWVPGPGLTEPTKITAAETDKKPKNKPSRNGTGRNRIKNDTK